MENMIGFSLAQVPLLCVLSVPYQSVITLNCNFLFIYWPLLPAGNYLNAETDLLALWNKFLIQDF